VVTKCLFILEGSYFFVAVIYPVLVLVEGSWFRVKWNGLLLVEQCDASNSQIGGTHVSAPTCNKNGREKGDAFQDEDEEEK
jgi:hypothetical protein